MFSSPAPSEVPFDQLTAQLAQAATELARVTGDLLAERAIEIGQIDDDRLSNRTALTRSQP